MGCEEYKADDDLNEQHICPAHQKPCEHREEENYFFRLTAYQQQLLVRAYVRYLKELSSWPAGSSCRCMCWQPAGCKSYTRRQAWKGQGPGQDRFDAHAPALHL